MGIPDATSVRAVMENRAREAKADLSWLAGYYLSLKIFQKTQENGGTEVPSPRAIMHDPVAALPPHEPTKRHFVEVFSRYQSVKPAHDFGHYINLSPVVFAVAILEEFIEQAYCMRTGGASLKKPNGCSRSLKRYISILGGEAPADLVPHPNPVVIRGVSDKSPGAIFLAKRRIRISHAYRNATFNANVASRTMPALRQAVRFIDDVTDLLLTEAAPRP